MTIDQEDDSAAARSGGAPHAGLGGLRDQSGLLNALTRERPEQSWDDPPAATGAERAGQAAPHEGLSSAGRGVGSAREHHEADGDAERAMQVQQPRHRLTAGTRSAALRRAREAKQARDARRRERDLAVEDALADYYAAVAWVEDRRAKANRRAAQILADTEDAVQAGLREADQALRQLRELGETRETIRELTQASLGRLREALGSKDSAHRARPGMASRPASRGGGRVRRHGAGQRDAAGAWPPERVEAHSVYDEPAVQESPGNGSEDR